MFPFRYKLSLIISLFALLVLIIAFGAVEGEIEKEFRLTIEQRLVQAQNVVSQRMEDRFARLFSQAVTASEGKLIRDLLTDRSLSRATCDDIVRDEVLPTLRMADSLLVTDGEGRLLADSSESDRFWQMLRLQPGFADGMAGEESTGLTLYDALWSQWVLLPVFIGDQMFGSVVLVSLLGEQELGVISQLTDTELLIASEQSFLATPWNGRRTAIRTKGGSPGDSIGFSDLVESTRAGAYAGQTTSEVTLDGERYLARQLVPENSFTPPFVVAQSLDQALAFIDTIKRVMLVIALIALVIATTLGFVVARSVASPIQALRDSTRAIALEDFKQRVDIRTRDEFRELGESFNQMCESLAEKAAVRSALDKSVSRDIADHLLRQGVELGGETREATILFADIRGFTTLSEQLTEIQLLELLNEYFTRINICIQQHKGTIDKFIGDAVMAIFGAPFDDPQHARHAIAAALKMTHAVRRFNEEVSDAYGCELHIGIGINTGQVVAGLVGSEDRLNYTVLGDQVNIASRIESLSKFYRADIVLTEATCAVAAHVQAGEKAEFAYRRLDKVQVKGKTVGIGVYQPLRAREGVEKRVQGYHEALAMMLDQQFEQACTAFEKYTMLWPSDKVAQGWLERCINYAGSPVSFAEDYRDGVRILGEK